MKALAITSIHPLSSRSWSILRFLMAALLGAAANAAPVAAQYEKASSYTTFDATPGEPVQLGYYAFVNNDCTPSRRPTVRIMESPSKGILTVRSGVLTMNAIMGCQGYSAPVQVTFYEARNGGADIDQVTYEVTNPNGDVAIYQIKIRILPSSQGASRER